MAFIVSVVGPVSISVLIAIVLSSLIALTEIRYRSKVRWGACITRGLFLYVAALGFGSTVTTVIVALVADYDWAGAWSPLINAVGGLGVFFGVLNNVNITYFDQGLLTIQNWTRKTRDIAEEAALEERNEVMSKLRTDMEESLTEISEEQLNTHLTDCCGEADLVKRLEAEADESDSDRKLYKALELADKAPGRARDILKMLDKNL